MTLQTNIVVVGAGNAAMCAAISAAEHGASVIVLEASPEEQKGGNTAYTHGSMRFAFQDGEQLRQLLPHMTDEEFAMTDFGSYPVEAFFDDVSKMSNYRADYDLLSVMTKKSFETMRWLMTHHVKWVPIYGRQAYKRDGKFTFWGNMVLEAVGGGRGLVDALHDEAKRLGVTIFYETAARALITEHRAVTGVHIQGKDGEQTIACDAVILANGGFHANVAMRTQYLGPGWDTVHTRGCKYNVGDGLNMAMAIGAKTTGNWSGAHAVGGDRYLPDFKEGFQKLSYPYGIIVNEDGKRFIDEGEDFRNYTYAKIGKAILQQPNQVAWQVFDAQAAPYLREEYNGRHVTKVRANTLEELAEKMEGINQQAFLAEVAAFNAAIDEQVAFNPNVLDGRATKQLAINKTNWANRIEQAPFEAYALTCGITFTYSGLKISKKAEVFHHDGSVIDGLYAAGEIVGGLYYDNYPGGAGLTSGAVFGKIAGQQAAKKRKVIHS